MSEPSRLGQLDDAQFAELFKNCEDPPLRTSYLVLGEYCVEGGRQGLVCSAQKVGQVVVQKAGLRCLHSHKVDSFEYEVNILVNLNVLPGGDTPSR